MNFTPFVVAHFLGYPVPSCGSIVMLRSNIESVPRRVRGIIHEVQGSLVRVVFASEHLISDGDENLFQSEGTSMWFHASRFSKRKADTCVIVRRLIDGKPSRKTQMYSADTYELHEGSTINTTRALEKARVELRETANV